MHINQKKIVHAIVILISLKTIIELTHFPEHLESISVFSEYLLTNPIFSLFPILGSGIGLLIPILATVGIVIFIFSKDRHLNGWLMLTLIFSIHAYLFYLCMSAFTGSSNSRENEGFDQFRMIGFQIIILSLSIFTVYYFLTKTFHPTGKNPINVSARKSIRFKNYFIDLGITGYFTFYTLALFSDSEIRVNEPVLLLVFMVNQFVYYSFSELLFRQTIGKVITNTFVYAESKFYKSVLVRTLCRHIPFEPFSFFAGKTGRWHDRWSNSILIKMK
ncbi:MAG: hypothetical protein MI921_00475 [Cytophagales bacterium]|nr:hypothetical protein [Cytophagales bacterium]